MIGATVIVLAAVLLPLVSVANDPTKLGQDASNLRVLARGVQIYVVDADDLFPPVGAPAQDYSWSPARDPEIDADGNPWNGWGLRMAPYAESYDSFRSASFPKTGSFTGECRHADGMRLTNSYSMNWMLGSDGSYGDGRDLGDPFAWTPDGTRRLSRPFRGSAVESPRNTVTFMPVGRKGSSDYGCLFLTVKSSAFGIQISPNPSVIEGTNLAMADGHARFVRDDRLGAGGSGWTLYHALAKHVWMEPTMPSSSLGYQNLDPQGHVAGDL